MSLISAEQARNQSESFDLNQQQVFDQIAKSIDSSSKVGKREIVKQFLKSAVSSQELEGALDRVRDQGYIVEVIEGKPELEKLSIRVSW